MYATGGDRGFFFQRLVFLYPPPRSIQIFRTPQAISRKINTPRVKWGSTLRPSACHTLTNCFHSGVTAWRLFRLSRVTRPPFRSLPCWAYSRDCHNASLLVTKHASPDNIVDPPHAFQQGPTRRFEICHSQSLPANPDLVADLFEFTVSVMQSVAKRGNAMGLVP